MSDLRAFELRQALGFARDARTALATGDLAKAVRYHGMGVKVLAFVRGLLCTRDGHRVTATAGLYAAIANIGDDIQAALRPPRRVEPWELVPHVFEGLKVLQREGVDVSDELLMARARNIATGLAASFRFGAIQ